MIKVHDADTGKLLLTCFAEFVICGKADFPHVSRIRIEKDGTLIAIISL